MSLSNANRVLALLSLGTLFFRTLATDLALMDGAEFAKAASSLGIAHPSGYPLFCVLAHGTMWLPLGNVAMRTALASALFGVFALALVELLLGMFVRRRAFATLGALLLGTAGVVWSQSIAAEVYSLHVLLLAGICLSVARWHRTRQHRWGYLFVFLLGLGFSNHHSLLLALPGLGLLALWCLIGRERGPSRERWRALPGRLVIAVVLFTIGLSGNLYLPLRSAADPPIDRGNPERIETLLPFMLKRITSSSKDTTSNSADNLRFHADRAREIFPQQLPPPFLLLVPIGLIVGFRRDRALFLGLATVSGVTTFMAMWSFYSRTREIAYLVDPFLMTGFLSLGALVVLGLDAVASLAPSRFARGAVLVVLMLGISSQVLGNFQPNDRSRDRTAALWARTVLEHAPRDAIVICFVDEYFPLAYLQLIEGMRPDVRVTHQVALKYYPRDWWTRLPDDTDVFYPTQGQAPRGDEAPIYRSALAAAFASSLERPVVLTALASEIIPEGYRPMVKGLIYQVQSTDGPLFPPQELFARWNRMDLGRLLDSRIPKTEAEENFVTRYVQAANNSAAYLWRGFEAGPQARGLLAVSLALREENPSAMRLLQEIPGR